MNYCINRCFIIGVVASLLVLPNICSSEAKGDEISSLEELLSIVRNGRIQDRKLLQEREETFKADKASQERLLNEAREALIAEEKLSASLEARYEENEIALTNQKELLNNKLGALKELFGHVTGTAGDLRATFHTSLTSAQIEGREAFLDTLIKKMNSKIELPSLEEIEQLWFEMQQEIVESGKIVRFDAKVVKPDGSQIQQPVTRVGTYNLLSKGKYLQFDGDTGVISELPKQPKSKYGDYIEELESLSEGFVPIGLDPTGPKGGSLLSALIDTPTLTERWHQGGVVGYIISVVGLFALLIAVWRFVLLMKLDIGVTRQLALQQAQLNNPLGRVLKVYEDNPGIDPESLELKLAEAIVKERPDIEKGLPALKIIAMVAPLMGLLGTVTGMIITFQAITIFGAGDPKAMAGGISAALVTTVLGLVVAIPTVLLHALLNARAKRILQVIEQQSAGLIAEQTESEEQAHVRAV
jgi:biopolymer transport protein ExbB